MKKTKFMIGVLVLSMGLLGTGYALWTDTLAVKTTVDTGNLNIKFDNLNKVDNYMNNKVPGVDGTYTTFKSTAKLAEGPASGDYNNSNDQIDITINEMVPGASTQVTARMVNDGTVAARLAKITPQVKEGSIDLQKALNVEIMVYDNDFVPITIYKGTLKELIDKKGVTITADLFGRDILFVPGKADDDIQLGINVEISKDATNEIQKQAASFTVDFAFEQTFELGIRN